MIQPAERVPLYQIVVNQILEAVKSGEWEIGTKIPSEEELSQKFQVGRNSIREGLKALQMFGILEARAGIGTIVKENALRKINNKDLVDLISDESSLMELMEMRMMIETQLAYIAAQRADDEDKKELRLFFKQLIDKINTSGEYTEEGFDFHMLIAKIARNRFAIRVLTFIAEELKIQREIMISKKFRVKESLSEHEEVMKAICDNDPERARDAMYRHFVKAIELLKELEHK